MSSSRLARVAVVASAVLAVACGDITRQKATYASSLAGFSVYTLTETPAAQPNALLFLGGVTRASSSFAFDVAFDFTPSGSVIVYPVRALGGAPAGTLKRVGLQLVPTSFDVLREAPATGYDTVNAKTVNVGSTIAVELRDATACFSYNLVSSQLLYGKMVIDSIIPATRRLYGRLVIDPNCGYRGLVPDSIPTN
jgi:hypothetical protein